jgi:hypothetical protein
VNPPIFIQTSKHVVDNYFEMCGATFVVIHFTLGAPLKLKHEEAACLLDAMAELSRGNRVICHMAKGAA